MFIFLSLLFVYSKNGGFIEDHGLSSSKNGGFIEGRYIVQISKKGGFIDANNVFATCE